MVNRKFYRLTVPKASSLIIMLFFISSFSIAQWPSGSKKDILESTKSDLLDSKTDYKGMLQASVTNAPALEGPVDPDKYYIGPSDVLSVNIWTSLPINFALTVTPEGTLIIPTVGEIKVVDLTLSDAKKKIIAEIKKKYATGNPTVTLIHPRQVVVTVIGAVAFAGKYTLDATERIDRAIGEANRSKKENEFGASVFQGRNIRLTRRNGEYCRVDIPKYYATKSDKWNPFVREGDEIFVPAFNPDKGIFAVYGAVNMPGSFEYVPGDSLLDALELAFGYAPHAIRDSIVLYRNNLRMRVQNLYYFKYNEINRGSEKNIPLEIGDRIIIKQEPDRREDFKVTVEGEVKYPGIYPITKENTDLMNVIGWCGGFTESASLLSAQVYRGTISRGELELERLLSLRGSVSPEDSANYLLESELRIRREVVNVDFKKLFIDKDTSQNIFLRNGDHIFIPSIRHTIYVFGQVINPGNLLYVPGEEYKYYIDKCGGYTDNARIKDVMIIKRTNRQWLVPGETKIEEGDYIWVPKEISHDFAYYMNIFSQTAAVITAAVSLALLAIQLK